MAARRFGAVGGRKLDDGKLEIFVHDDGPGIPAEALDRVFERFYRVGQGGFTGSRRHGAGLSIVKHIVHAHGGRGLGGKRIGERVRRLFSRCRPVDFNLSFNWERFWACSIFPFAD